MKFALAKFLPALWLIAVAVAFNPWTREVFRLPKMLAYTAACALLAFLPRLPGTLAVAFAFAASSIALFLPAQASMEVAYLIGGGLLFSALRVAPNESWETLRQSIIFSSVGLALVALAEWGGTALWSPASLVDRSTQGTISLIGNPEFLATWLGAGLLLHLHSHRRSRLLTLVLLLGITTTLSKGTMILVLVIFLWQKFPALRRHITLGGALLVLLVGIASHSVRSRLFLWAVGLEMLGTNPITGVGFGNFANRYLTSVTSIFERWPALRSAAGDLSGVVSDAHNIFIQAGAELGMMGILAVASLFVVIVRKVKSSTDGWAAVLALVAVKSLYTVVLSSPVSFALGLTALASPGAAGPCVGQDSRRLLTRIGLLATATALVLCSLDMIRFDRAYQVAYQAAYQKKLALARGRTDAALEYHRQSGDAWLLDAYVSYLEGDYGPMRASLARAVNYAPTFNTYKLAARLQYLTGDYSTSAKTYLKIHKAYPEHLTSVVKLSENYYNLGELDRAFRYACASLKLNPRVRTSSHSANRAKAQGLLQLLGGVPCT